MNLIALILAIIMVESGGNNQAFNESENAAGCLQIRPICVKDINRIIGEEKYCLNDRYDRVKSIEMFKIYTSHYYNRFKKEICQANISEFEAKARIWNGGPLGWQKDSTKKYWLLVKEQLEE